MFKLVIQDDEGKTTVVPLIRDEITIGRKEGNTIRLTVENRVGGVARRLTAKARSSHPAIDDKVFDFGDLGAGETKTRYIEVELPGDEQATTITMVAEFSLDTHKPPPNMTAQLAVTPRATTPRTRLRASPPNASVRSPSPRDTPSHTRTGITGW